VFVVGETVKPGTDIGLRKTFSDLGQTLAEVFAVGTLDHGTSFLSEIQRH
jgi:phosphopentomutase